MLVYDVVAPPKHTNYLVTVGDLEPEPGLVSHQPSVQSTLPYDINSTDPLIHRMSGKILSMESRSARGSYTNIHIVVVLLSRPNTESKYMTVIYHIPPTKQLTKNLR